MVIILQMTYNCCQEGRTSLPGKGVANGPVRERAQADDASADHRGGRPSAQAGRDQCLWGGGAHGRRRPDQWRLYAHFDSKEDLVASTVADQLGEQRELYSTQSLEEIVRGYLSPQHRDDTEGGCPSAALLDEIVRSSDAVKRAYTDGQLAIIDDAAARLAPDDPQSKRVQALTVFALMVGTLQLSRALADRQLADDVLDQGIHNALALLGVQHQG